MVQIESIHSEGVPLWFQITDVNNPKLVNPNLKKNYRSKNSFYQYYPT